MNRRELLGLMGLVGFESVPRYRELLYKLISEDLEFPPPGFTIESDRIEWSFLKDETRWSTTPHTVAAVAAQFGFLQIFNPIGSGRLVTVTDWFVANVTANRRFIHALTTTIRGVGSNDVVPNDTRWFHGVIPTGALSARDPASYSIGSSAAFGSDLPIGADNGAPVINSYARLNLRPVTLLPGTGVLISNALVNEAFDAWAAGYSRQARPEELTP